MSSFLSEIRKGSTNKSSRVVSQISKELQKLKAQNVVIEDENLIDNGKTVRGRAIIDGTKLIYSRKITTIPTHKVPVEPDREFLTFWTKANHTGLNLIDSSKFDNVITVNNNKHLCLNDSGGLNLGYLGQKNGVNSVPAWSLNGINESAQVDDNTRLQIKNTATGFSITAWIKPASFATHNNIERRVVAKTDDTNNAYAIFVTPTNKAVTAFKHADGTQFKVETPASSLVANTWYFIAATFKSSATKEAKIYLNGTVSTTAYSPTVTYPDSASFPSTKLQLFGNGIAQLEDPIYTDLPVSETRGDTGDFHGQIRDVRIWREKILSQTEITQFNTNRVSISNLALGESHIAGFVWCPGDIGLSSFTTTSFSNVSFNL